MATSQATRAHADSNLVTGISDDRLDLVVEIMREMSLQSDPQGMVTTFRKRALQLYGGDASMSLSRRGLKSPSYRITRSTRWSQEINPWDNPEKLPQLSGGLLGELIYGDHPQHIRNFVADPADPAYEYLQDARSLMALPIFDGGHALNMVVRMCSKPDGFDRVGIADALLIANLFGRATNNLVVAKRLEKAYAELDLELRRVAQIQRALLPLRLPNIPTLDMAAWYQTAARAGGDYYDFFDLKDGRWGVLIADVSGHGTPAAVVMAMLRTLLHSQCYQCVSASELLHSTNQQLCTYSDRLAGSFVTAFYGVYDPASRELRYSSAGHNPPLLVDGRKGVRELDDAHALPLAVDRGCEFDEGKVDLARGDTLLMYTDGITEAANPGGELYGLTRLLSCIREDAPNAQHIVDCVTGKLAGFTDGGAQLDDQTLLAMRVQ